MGHGGKRRGAGVKKGSTQKIPRAVVARDLGPRILEVLTQMMNSKSKADRKWAIHEALPYAIQKQPQDVKVGNTDNKPLQLQLIMPEKYPFVQ